MRCGILTLLVGAAVILACTTSPKPIQANTATNLDSTNDTSAKSALATPPETGEPALHAIRNQQLEQVMRQINVLVYGKMRNEVELTHEKQVRAKEIAKLAHELAENVTVVRSALPGLNLTQNEQTTFAALATKLQTDARQIEADARVENLGNIPATMEHIMMTCTSCHALFRKSRNLLDRCKDPASTC